MEIGLMVAHVAQAGIVLAMGYGLLVFARCLEGSQLPQAGDSDTARNLRPHPWETGAAAGDDFWEDGSYGLFGDELWIGMDTSGPDSPFDHG